MRLRAAFEIVRKEKGMKQDYAAIEYAYLMPYTEPYVEVEVQLALGSFMRGSAHTVTSSLT